MQTSFFMCPVCGYPDLMELPRRLDGGGSDEICPSCGFQFGFDDDDRGFSFDMWRQDWIERGMPWSSKGIPRPIAWDPMLQLQKLRQ
jgi:hypothetical protein